MSSFIESSGKKKKSKLEEIFERIENTVAGAAGDERTRLIQSLDADKKKTHEDFPRQLDKSMKGKY